MGCEGAELSINIDDQRGDQNDSLQIFIKDYKQIIWLQLATGEFSDEIGEYFANPIPNTQNTFQEMSKQCLNTLTAIKLLQD